MKRERIALLVVTGLFISLTVGCAGKEASLVRTEVAPPAAEALAAPQVNPEAAAGAERDVTNSQQETAETSGMNVEAVPAAELAAALETIYFDYDRYTLSPEAREILGKSAELLADKKAKLQIAGHCDERGSGEYNLALSERRAVAAREYLVALGVPRERVAVIGYGKEKPAVPGHDEAAWAQNRRDEFLIVAE